MWLLWTVRVETACVKGTENGDKFVISTDKQFGGWGVELGRGGWAGSYPSAFLARYNRRMWNEEFPRLSVNCKSLIVSILFQISQFIVSVWNFRCISRRLCGPYHSWEAYSVSKLRYFLQSGLCFHCIFAVTKVKFFSVSVFKQIEVAIAQWKRWWPEEPVWLGCCSCLLFCKTVIYGTSGKKNWRKIPSFI